MNDFKNVLVIGAGSWGTSLAKILAINIKTVFIYGRSIDVIQDIKDNHRNSAFLPGVMLPKNIRATNVLADFLPQADLLVVATPVASLAEIFKSMAKIHPNLHNFLLCSKGIDCKSLKLPSSICREFFPEANLAIMSGPNFAKEIAAEKIAKTIIAAENIKFAQQLQQAFLTKHFYPEITQDTVAVEVCGAYKNVLAIAMGIAKGLELGANFLAAFFLKSLAEMKVLVKRLGGNAEVVNSLAGMGDLLLTGYSMSSRNTKFGCNIALKANMDNKEVVEGYFTTQSLYLLAQKLQINLPICNYVYHVLNSNCDLSEIKRLL